MRRFIAKPVVSKTKEANNSKDVPKFKKRYPGFRKNIHNYITQYTENASIHGFKYLGETGRSCFEKFFWGLLLCLALYICVIHIRQTWIKWDTAPVLVNFARIPTPIWQIPFPAITICLENKIKQRAYNFTEIYLRYTDSLQDPNASSVNEAEMYRFREATLLCPTGVDSGQNLTMDFDVIERLIKFAPQFDEVFYICRWNRGNETCSDLFTSILTEDGLCFTFNMLDRSDIFRDNVFFHGDYMKSKEQTNDWFIESGYAINAPTVTYPRRTITAGPQAGFYFILRSYKQDLDYICRGPTQGYRIFLHHPADVPRINSQYYRVPLNQEVAISVKPDLVTTSRYLAIYEPHRRQCFYQYERPLLFYKGYTQENCQMECLANFTLENCGCVGYYMPHEQLTPICGLGSLKCIFDTETELIQREIEIVSEGSSNSNQSCDCLPSCTSLTYNMEMSQSQYEWPDMLRAFGNDPEGDPGLQMTKVTVFFKDQQFMLSEKNKLFELYEATDFLANCGGILSLFTGFSFMTIVEIIYFLSLRLMCNLKKYGRHYWSESKDLLNDDAYTHKIYKT